MFGLNLVYKLRNASSEVYKEKLVLSVTVFIGLLVSSAAYALRHTFWHRLTNNQLLLLYAFRCQLTVSLGIGLIFVPKVS